MHIMLCSCCTFISYRENQTLSGIFNFVTREVYLRGNMSLLSAVEEAIKTYKAEQVRLNHSIQFHREILHSLIPQPEAGSEETELADNAAADAESSPGEKEDIELLEQALEKALRVRTGSEVSKQDSGKRKLSTTKATERMPALSAVTKHDQPTIKSSKKSASLHGKGPKKPSVSHSSRPSAGHKPAQSKNRTQHHPSSAARAGHHQQTVLAGFKSPDQITASLSTNKTVRSNMPRDDGLSKSVSVPMPSSDDMSFSGTDGPGVGSLHQHNGGLSEEIAKWKSLRSKQNRLWDKVIALQRNPEPGRSRFMQRIRTTFPSDWPSGSPNETRFQLHRLTDQAFNLAHVCQTENILASEVPEMDTGLPGGKQTKSHSSLTPEGLQLAAAELHVLADKVKREWKAWDRWRPKGGCLCPSEAAGLFADGAASPLPLTVTYSTQQELQQLEELRMRVALLQQETYFEQALLDSLSSQFSSIRPGPGCPSPSMLRDMYSLLGEGGERFAAIVQDSEHE
ncbi:uncharacterized protein C16orf59 homolog [Poecilia formosa]|uniref:uncharacterized protein C16orf59 homolog n=1 Tax=Poecilia formosa TaxID=48698 RepID=UPI000444546D|nr:PREDICTED: uncharacterized protein C16orf59 homolog [Poecilia formosa]